MLFKEHDVCIVFITFKNKKKIKKTETTTATTIQQQVFGFWSTWKESTIPVVLVYVAAEMLATLDHFDLIECIAKVKDFFLNRIFTYIYSSAELILKQICSRSHKSSDVEQCMWLRSCLSVSVVWRCTCCLCCRCHMLCHPTRRKEEGTHLLQDKSDWSFVTSLSRTVLGWLEHCHQMGHLGKK